MIENAGKKKVEKEVGKKKGKKIGSQCYQQREKKMAGVHLLISFFSRRQPGCHGLT